MNALVSIIVPSYNKGQYISDTINSVISQTYCNWELIIVDDVSVDNTIDIINAFKEKGNRINLFVNAENKGANYSRNFGAQNAKGEYIIFLDADDLLSNTCLQNRLTKIENTDLDFCVFSMGTFYKEIGDSKSVWIPNSKRPLIDFLQHVLPWQTMQPIWRKDFFILLGGFDEEFKRLQDVELHTRTLLQKKVNFKQIAGIPDCYYRINEERKNYSSYNFLNKWVDSSVMYYVKFYNSAKKINSDNHLNGTIYKTYLRLIYEYKHKGISKNEFVELEKKLLNSEIIVSLNSFRKVLLKIAKIYNLYLLRIPSVNWILNKLICMAV